MAENIWVEIPLEFLGNKGSWRIYFDSKFGKKLLDINDALQKAFFKIGEDLTSGKVAQAASDEPPLSLTAYGTGLTGDVETNTITGGTVTSFKIETVGKHGISSTTISGFEPQDAVTFFNNVKSNATDYEYLISLMAGDTVASVKAGAKGDALFDTGAGDDTVTGGLGDDEALKWLAGDLTYDGGKGVDTLSFSGRHFTETPAVGATVNLAAGIGSNPYGGALTLKNVENVNGTAANDVLNGNGAGNRLNGYMGYDRIFGAGGNDTIYVRRDMDGTSGAIVADGGSGKDTLFITGYDFAGTNVLDLENPDAYSGMFVGFTVTGFEVIQTNLSGGNVDLRGTEAGEKLQTANIGDNLISGRGGDDTLIGGFGNDVIDGGSGNDRIDGGGDNDTMTGGAGNDTFSVDSAGDVVKEAAKGGTDTVISDVAIDLSKAAWKNIENVTYTGDGGENLKLVGSSAANVLKGSDRTELIDGGDGNDTIAGGTGGDILTGGKGNDTFIFSNEVDIFGNSQRIMDFGVGHDVIDLHSIDGNRGKKGNQALDFINGGDFSKHAGDVRVEHEHMAAGNVTIIQIEVNGDRKADFEIFLTGNIKLQENDFLL